MKNKMSVVKKVSLKNIANEAKCGITSVSRYLNGVKVSDELSIKIKLAIEKFNYIQNPNAIALRKLDNVFFVISPATTNPRTQIIIQELNTLFKNEVFIFSIQIGYNPNHFKRAIMNILLRNPSHIIIFLPYENQDLISYINSVREFNFIIVTSSNKFEKHHTCVFIDDYFGFFELTKILIEVEKFDNLVFIGVNPNEHNLSMESYNARNQGFLGAIKASNLKIKNKVVFCKENTVEYAQKEIVKLLNLGFSNFICGTHTIFRASLASKEFANFVFTDYGNKHLSDLANKHKYKVFVDYGQISAIIYHHITHDENPKKFVIKPLIEKNLQYLEKQDFHN